ncbi:MAG: ABC-F family ATP-binding cassette domain-containing protein [Treponema sp.]|nr:ABC-F family ATP-binding cassette domain-containing protein [Treponema sp.]
MSILISNLYFSYASSNSTLFEDFSLQLNEGWTCIAGSNGCGKSTLLKLIAGIIKPDNGKLSSNGKAYSENTSTTECVYCPQETAEIPENLYTAFWSDDNEVRRFFSRLNVTEEMLERYDTLSGGEKKRIQIACALAEQPSVLLLDEPTNHLDAATTKMIFAALSDFRGTGIMVSHDRTFADSLCTRTVYLYNESQAFAGGRDCIACDTYPCGLTKALELRQNSQNQSRNDWEKLNSKAAGEKQRSEKLEAENQRAKSRLSKKVINPNDHDAQAKIDVARISGKDRSTGDAKARLETQIRQTEAERDSIKKSLRRKEGFSVEKTDFAKPIVIQETQIKAGDYTLSVPHIEIKRGTKLALTGQNGAGKTLFVRHVISLLENSGRQNELLYLPQEISEQSRSQILADFYKLEEAERGEVLSTLFRLGSEPERLNQLRSVSSASDPQLSPGELRKLMIALAVQKPLSLLILDEPTNHMDITSVLALETALASLDCAMLVVSHDRLFLDKITNSSLVVERNDEQKGEIKKI